MAFVTPPKGKAFIEDSPRLLRITVPPSRPLFTIAFLSLWLLGFASIGGFILLQFLPLTDAGPPVLFLLVFLVGWVFAVATTSTTILWLLSGQQIISLEGTHLSVKWSLLGFGGSREFAVDSIANLRVDPLSSLAYSALPRTPDWGRLAAGPIAFDYGAATFRFGLGLPEAEAVTVKWKLAARLPASAAG